MENRIKPIRLKIGLSQEQVAVAAGTTKATVMKLEKGDMQLTQQWMERISRALGCAPTDLIADTGRAKLIPLVGYVGAGAEIYAIDDHAKGAALEEIEAPQGMNLHGYVAVRVKGDSMYPRYFEGEIIVYKRDVDWSDDCINKECVVGLEDGRTFVKVVRRGSKPGFFTLESHNAPLIHDVQIRWACCKLIRL